MDSVNKVALNTIVLYGRLLITIGITLYTTRLVLEALGDIDYGIFVLISGVILMLSFLNAAMTTSTQRFLSFYQGKKDVEMQRIIFANSLVLHVLIGLLLILVLEIVGYFLFNGLLSIPFNRIEAAKAVYHYMSITVFVTIFGVPFQSSLVAHENMIWVALTSIIEAVLKLLITYCLFFLPGDRLELYGLLTVVVTIIIFIITAAYCILRYPECSLNKVVSLKNIAIMKKLGSFAGWNLFGALCSLGKSQGIAVILNIFNGASINASYGISNQVSSQMNFLSATMQRAINPQIMKSEGAGDRSKMLDLSIKSSKFSFFLLSIVAIPAIFEMDTLLKIWLKNVPEYTTIFCSLFLISSMINQLTIGLQSAVQATGNVKFYQTIVGSTLLLNIPIAYLLLYFNFPVYYVIASFSLVEIIACVLRLLILRKLAGLSILTYYKRVFLREVIPVIVIVSSSFIISLLFHSFYRIFVNLAVSSIAYLIAIYFFGLETIERKFIKDKCLVLFKKVFNKC